MKTIKVTYDNCRLLIGQELLKKEDFLKLIDELQKPGSVFPGSPEMLISVKELKARIEEETKN